ncbi:hypothetical protein LJC71_07715 [Desulfosarcina sp. OttesenSCG-928-A07]|nr:hypothetical protein [Desulfosarcina sp. OttesenSCG-928-G17]MDL2329611.1 hypothetical protein [Desulfosarcina sp. OttesenSCG-928-A07]
MKIQNKTKVRIGFLTFIIAFLLLIFYQNKAFFMVQQSLMLDLGFFSYKTPELSNFIFFVTFFLFGILITYFSSLFKHFKDAKTIKQLKAKEAALIETVANLEARLGGVPDDPSSSIQASPVQEDMTGVEQKPMPASDPASSFSENSSMDTTQTVK